MPASFPRTFLVLVTAATLVGCAAGGPSSPGRRGVGVEPPLGAPPQEPTRPMGPASEAPTSPEIIRYDLEAVRAAGLARSGPNTSRIAPAEPGVPIEEAADPRIRAILPDARCEKPSRVDEQGRAPRCVASLRRACSAMGADTGGSLVVVSLIDWSVTTWTVPELALMRALQPMLTEKDPSVIAVSDARREALITVTGQIFRYDLTSGRQLGVSEGPGGRIGALSWSQDGSRVLVLAGGAAHLLDGDLRVQRRLDAGAEAVTVAVSSDGRRAAVGTATGSVALFDLAAGGAPRVLSLSTQPVASVAFAAAGVVVAGRDGTLRVLDASSGRELSRTNVGVPLARLVISPDGKRAATTARDFAIRLHTLPGGKVNETIRWHRANFAGMAWGKDDILVVIDNDGDLAAWEVAGR